MTNDPILFYDQREPYGFFSNFSRHRVEIYGRIWMTSEHPFQAMKFLDPLLQERVWAAMSPGKAAEIGRDRSLPLRADWDDPDPTPEPPYVELVKDRVMYDVVTAKFTQHHDLGLALLGTGHAILIENAIHDPYWGWGSSRTGVNRLGKILMAVRDKLRR